MKFACDFCGNLQCRYRFPNPRIESKLFNLVIEPGYFLACIEDTLLLEDRKYGELAMKAVKLPQYAAIREALDHEHSEHFFHQEMMSIYRKLSRKREPF